MQVARVSDPASDAVSFTLLDGNGVVARLNASCGVWRRPRTRDTHGSRTAIRGGDEFEHRARRTLEQISRRLRAIGAFTFAGSHPWQRPEERGGLPAQDPRRQSQPGAARGHDSPRP